MCSIPLSWVFAAPALGAEDVCGSDPYRQFDFWLGEWEVLDAEGQVAGRNHITREQQGCLLVERWRGAQGTSGMSMNYYDPAAGHWRQVWVSPGLSIDIQGGLEDGTMVLEGEAVYLKEARARPFRGTWTPLPDGRVRQYFEQVGEDGEWQPWFEGFYQPAEDDES